MERETYEFTTTGGHKIQIKKDMTGREKRAIEGVIQSANTYAFDMKSGQVVNDNFELSGAAVLAHSEMMVSQLVVSIDSITTDVLNKILDLPSVDSDEVFAEVSRQYSELSQNAKKKT